VNIVSRFGWGLTKKIEDHGISKFRQNLQRVRPSTSLFLAPISHVDFSPLPFLVTASHVRASSSSLTSSGGVRSPSVLHRTGWTHPPSSPHAGRPGPHLRPRHSHLSINITKCLMWSLHPLQPDPRHRRRAGPAYGRGGTLVLNKRRCRSIPDVHAWPKNI
jgi:hypothetical protein